MPFFQRALRPGAGLSQAILKRFTKKHAAPRDPSQVQCEVNCSKATATLTSFVKRALRYLCCETWGRK